MPQIRSDYSYWVKTKSRRRALVIESLESRQCTLVSDFDVQALSTDHALSCILFHQALHLLSSRHVLISDTKLPYTLK